MSIKDKVHAIHKTRRIHKINKVVHFSTDYVTWKFPFGLSISLNLSIMNTHRHWIETPTRILYPFRRAIGKSIIDSRIVIVKIIDGFNKYNLL